eukprot:scaffold26038_cov230-Cylindrotheca_fusiformis.AAC.1
MERDALELHHAVKLVFEFAPRNDGKQKRSQGEKRNRQEGASTQKTKEEEKTRPAAPLPALAAAPQPALAPADSFAAAFSTVHPSANNQCSMGRLCIIPP